MIDREVLQVVAAVLAAVLVLHFGLVAFRHARLHAAYVAGNAERVSQLLERADLNLKISLSTALGRYTAALELAKQSPAILDSRMTPDSLDWLHRINASEALVELGRLDEARALLAPKPPNDDLLRAGRAVGLAWTLSCAGHDMQALELLDSARPVDLGRDYAAEAFLTRALILLNLGRLESARAALNECRRLTVRASTDRNLLLCEARWLVMSGRLDEALVTFATARDHRWKCQGGAGYLALGDSFRAAGSLEAARACWSLAVERDPESVSAARCAERLGGPGIEPTQS